MVLTSCWTLRSSLSMSALLSAESLSCGKLFHTILASVIESSILPALFISFKNCKLVGLIEYSAAFELHSGQRLSPNVMLAQDLSSSTVIRLVKGLSLLVAAKAASDGVYGGSTISAAFRYR